MLIFPAIDLKNGQCVRLYQGDYSQVTTYDTDPVAVARRWQEAGARWLHVVDLDGAAAGQPVNHALIARICRETTLKVEVGGGLRTLEHIESTLERGATRVILGTVALTERTLLEQAIQRWGERVFVGLDARAGSVAINAWRETSQVRATTLARELSAAGVRGFIYTDIACDGAMQGPNLAALRDMQTALHDTAAALIASGGVTSLADVQQLASLNLHGAIIGKALYTGAIDLRAALHTREEHEPC